MKQMMPELVHQSSSDRQLEMNASHGKEEMSRLFLFFFSAHAILPHPSDPCSSQKSDSKKSKQQTWGT